VRRTLRAGLVALLAATVAPVAHAYESRLRFERNGELVREMSIDALRDACSVQRVTVRKDPYYGGRKRFVACPLGEVIALGFGEPLAKHAGENFFLRARDGYARPAAAETLAERGGFLAFADADHARGDDPGWQPIDRRQVDPGPFYLVWVGTTQSDPHRYPWPYQLAAIEIAPFERRYPHTVPKTAPPDAPAWQGFAIFRRECSACHAVNGEGGSVGPDLNVPRSIVEYRPVDQIRAYVRDPRAFRYTSMPAHRHLSDEQLDALVAYFEAMKELKHDPGAR
jgi:mono/diheme cytochrome c family protein